MTRRFFIAILCMGAAFAWAQIPPQIQLKPVPQIFVTGNTTNPVYLLKDNLGNILTDNNGNSLQANP